MLFRSDKGLVDLKTATIFHMFFKKLWDSNGDLFGYAIKALPAMAHLDFALYLENFTYDIDIVEKIKSPNFYLPFSIILPAVFLFNK